MNAKVIFLFAVVSLISLSRVSSSTLLQKDDIKAVQDDGLMCLLNPQKHCPFVKDVKYLDKFSKIYLTSLISFPSLKYQLPYRYFTLDLNNQNKLFKNGLSEQLLSSKFRGIEGSCQPLINEPKSSITFEGGNNNNNNDNDNDNEEKFLKTFNKLLQLYHPNQKPDQTDLDNTIETFLEEFAATKSGKELKDLIGSKDNAEFEKTIKDIWFGSDPLGEVVGFRHVFVGEIKNGKRGKRVTGFHNSIQFNTLNKNGELSNVEIKKEQTDPVLCNIKFEWNGAKKPISTILFGIDPADEIAVFTWCFHFFPDQKCYIKIGEYEYVVQTFKNKKGGSKLASAYFVFLSP